MRPAAMLLLGAALLACASSPSVSPDVGTTYYVDAASGDDRASGTAPGSAWRTLERASSVTYGPGDRLLLRAGGRYDGGLRLSGSGAPGAPVVVGRYGDGPRPHIVGGGRIRDAVWLHNGAHWTIRDIEISNAGRDTSEVLRGVYVSAEDVGEVRDIRLVGLDVHDVTGTLTTKHNGGIFFEILGDADPTWFDGFVIDSTTVRDVDRTGISNTSTWWDRTVDDDGEWVPSRNVVIRNTVVERAGQNAVIVRVTDGAVVEHSTFRDNGRKGNGNAVFAYNTDNTVVQYCEASGTFYNEGEADAAGFDSDGRNKGMVIQYNYSHGNGLGGVVLAVQGRTFNVGTVIRYNVFEDNAREGIRVSGTPVGTLVHNNVFVNRGAGPVRMVYFKDWEGYADRTAFHNNVFVHTGGEATYDYGQSTGNVFSHNLFYGDHTAPPADETSVLEAPRFVGTGGEMAAYGVLWGSPAIGAGVALAGDVPDPWGIRQPTGSPNIGVYAGPGLESSSQLANPPLPSPRH